MVSVFKDGSHQRISSLARDVRDLQPGLIKDSTLMRPCVVSNQTADNSRPLATEAHPNPSIPELAEENVRGKKELFLKFHCHLFFSTEITVEVLEKLCLKKQMAPVRKLFCF